MFEPLGVFQARHSEQAIALTECVFPGEPSLVGKFYYDTPPSHVAYTLEDETLIAIRPINRRSIAVRDGGTTLRIAGGLIPAVHPDHRRRGIGAAMAERILEELTALEDDYSLVFLFEGAPAWFMEMFGYAQLEAHFTYEDRETGGTIKETARAFGKSLHTSPDAEAEMDAIFANKNRIHLGRGIW